MNIISRYILRSHIGPFLFGFSTVVFIFLMQFILNSLDKMVGKGLEADIILQAIILNLPWMVVLAAPMGVLFSTLMAFGSMSANFEIAVIKSSGGSLYKMIKPLVVFGILLSALMFWFNDVVLPESNHRAKVLMNDIQRKKPTFAIQPGQFSTQMEGNVILSRKIDSASGMLYGVTIYDNTKVQQQNIVSADSGKIGFSQDYSHLIVDLFNGEIHQRKTRNLEDYKIINFKEYQLKLEASGYDFSKSEGNLISRGDREMRISDMQEVVNSAKEKKLRSEHKIDSLAKLHLKYLIEGEDFREQKKSDKDTLSEKQEEIKADTSEKAAYQSVQRNINFLASDIKSNLYSIESALNNIRQYEVEIWKKYSIPLACFVFVFVGVPLGIRTKGGNFGISAAISLGFYIVYWACLIGGEKLADRGMLSPFLSMFLADFIIGIIGMFLTIKTNNEMFELRSLFRKQ